MAKKFEQKGLAEFKGLTVTKTVVLKVKLGYEEILTSVNLLKGLNNDITVYGKSVSDKSFMNLGMFTIGSISFDKDGNATVPFKSLIDGCNLENICKLSRDAKEDDGMFHIKFQALLELPESEEKEESSDEDDDWEDSDEDWDK